MEPNTDLVIIVRKHETYDSDCLLLMEEAKKHNLSIVEMEDDRFEWYIKNLQKAD